MKVGDYVRTTKGIIKVAKIENDIIKDTKCYMHYGDFIKSSPNIIDLIKNEDLLKIIYPIGKNKDLFQEEITQVIENEDNKLYIKLYTEKYVFLEDFSKYDIEIKSIVTKEQFEQMEYRIGDDE